MLTYLRVRNLGLIEDAAIEPTSGLTVITGETGTGKTLLLGALRLLVGDKPNNSSVGPFGASTDVDGVFEWEGSEVGVSRNVPASGRSRAFLEGKVVSSSALAEEIGPRVLIAGQHEHIRLGTGAQLLHLIDEAVDRGHPGVRARYDAAWERLDALRREQDEIGGDTLALNRELDLLDHQVTEIDQAGIDHLDDDGAEALIARLRNLDSIRSELGETLAAVDLISDQAGVLVSGMRRLSTLDPSLSTDMTAAETVAEQVTELRRSLRTVSESIDLSESERLEMERLVNRVGELKRRYGRTIREVREFRSSAKARVDELGRLLDRAGTLDAEVVEATAMLESAADMLSQARIVTASGMSRGIRDHLSDLGLEGARVELEVEDVEPMRSGANRVSLRFASDERLAAGSVADVASGGELSRLVLALRLAAGPDTATTLVFDEADAGIGGKTALALGEKLAALSDGSQVIVVTHLPQVAAQADRHYVVDRGDSKATVREVQGDDRVVELSRMLAGIPDSPGGREAATELLAAARG